MKLDPTDDHLASIRQEEKDCTSQKQTEFQIHPGPLRKQAFQYFVALESTEPQGGLLTDGQCEYPLHLAKKHAVCQSGDQFPLLEQTVLCVQVELHQLFRSKCMSPIVHYLHYIRQQHQVGAHRNLPNYKKKVSFSKKKKKIVE